MWHGLVEAPSATSAGCSKTGLGTSATLWEKKDLYHDDLGQYLSQDIRRHNAAFAPGTLPPDRLVQKVVAKESRKRPVDISGLQDGSLHKQVEVGNGTLEARAPIEQGSRVRVSITVVRADKDLPPADRIIHGPADHEWIAGSGSRCELVELAVASMRGEEACTVTCDDPALYADAGLGVEACPRGVEYSLHLRTSCLDLEEEEASESLVLALAARQVEVAKARRKDGMVGLALVQNRLVRRKILDVLSASVAGATGVDNAATDALTEANRAMPSTDLLRLVDLSWAECLLALGRPAEACALCTEALSSCEDLAEAFAEILLVRGQALRKLGRITEACRDFESALAKQVNCPEAKVHLDQCRRLADKAEAARRDRAQLRKERAGRTSRGKWD